MKILYFSPSSFGGLADYAHAQADALVGNGAEVILLCGPDFPDKKRRYHRLPNLIPHRPGAGGSKWSRGFRMARNIIENHRILAREVQVRNCRTVLFGAYAEYFSPLWANQLKRLRDVRFGAVVHDPVRNTVRGPAWWHRASVAAAYSVFDVVFIHEPIALDTGGKRTIQTEIVPHGLYTFPFQGISKQEARKRLDLPENKPVLLMFGHIRDSKNLDLVIDILPRFPEVHLVVAGKEQSGSERPARFYQDFAQRNRVDERCHWFTEHITDDNVELFFAAADLLLLPYNAGFRSASGVLNTAVQFRLPCLATSGDGPLKTAVREFDLGIWEKPDDSDALENGLRKFLQHPPKPDWERYENENAWSKNAQQVINAFFKLETSESRKTVDLFVPETGRGT